jgi:hypothetical protein
MRPPRSEIAHLLFKVPPDVRWPGLFCPMCSGSLESSHMGWFCAWCEAGWLFDGTAGTWVEPVRRTA